MICQFLFEEHAYMDMEVFHGPVMCLKLSIMYRQMVKSENNIFLICNNTFLWS